MIVRALESQSVSARRWSSREMAKASGVSASSVQRIWRAIIGCIDKRNEEPKPFKWVRTADQILNAVKRYCERIAPPAIIQAIPDSGH